MRKERDWLGEKDFEKVTEVIDEVREYVVAKEGEMKTLKPNETPSTRASVVETKVKRVKEAYKKLEKKKKKVRTE